jgi:hypothetical protein
MPVINASSLKDAVIITRFPETRYLYWLKGFTLCRSAGKGVVSMARLMVTFADMTYNFADLDMINYGYTNTNSMCRTKTDLPILLKMRGGLICIIKA